MKRVLLGLLLLVGCDDRPMTTGWEDAGVDGGADSMPAVGQWACDVIPIEQTGPCLYVVPAGTACDIAVRMDDHNLSPALYAYDCAEHRLTLVTCDPSVQVVYCHR